VSGFGANGQVLVKDINGYQYNLPFKGGLGHIAHDYYTTSYSSQSKTVDKVMVLQSSQSLGASNAKQVYVSMSRGKDISVYTDDKDMLVQMAEYLPDEMSGSEMVERAEEEILVNSEENDKLLMVNDKLRVEKSSELGVKSNEKLVDDELKIEDKDKTLLIAEKTEDVDYKVIDPVQAENERLKAEVAKLQAELEGQKVLSSQTKTNEQQGIQPKETLEVKIEKDSLIQDIKVSKKQLPNNVDAWKEKERNKDLLPDIKTGDEGQTVQTDQDKADGHADSLADSDKNVYTPAVPYSDANQTNSSKHRQTLDRLMREGRVKNNEGNDKLSMVNGELVNEDQTKDNQQREANPKQTESDTPKVEYTSQVEPQPEQSFEEAEEDTARSNFNDKSDQKIEDRVETETTSQTSEKEPWEEMIDQVHGVESEENTVEYTPEEEVLIAEMMGNVETGEDSKEIGRGFEPEEEEAIDDIMSEYGLEDYDDSDSEPKDRGMGMERG